MTPDLLDTPACPDCGDDPCTCGLHCEGCGRLTDDGELCGECAYEAAAGNCDYDFDRSRED